MLTLIGSVAFRLWEETLRLDLHFHVARLHWRKCLHVRRGRCLVEVVELLGGVELKDFRIGF